MKVQLYKFTEDKNKTLTFRWTKNTLSFVWIIKSFLNHKGKKSYKERNLFFSKGDKITIEDNVIAEEYSTMPVKISPVSALFHSRPVILQGIYI